MESHLSIHDVAKRTGLTPYTLRYYERIGLIAPIGRAANGKRRYAVSDMAWIEFLLRLRTTRMPIGKMREFARLRGAGDSTLPDRRQMLEEHLADILSEVEAMRESATVLQAKIAHYRLLEQSFASDSNSNERYADEHSRSLRTRTRKTTRNRR